MRPWKSIWILMALALVLDGAILLHTWRTDFGRYTIDSFEYLLAGQNLLHRHTLYCGDLSAPIQPQYYTRRPPLYPAMTAMISLFTESHLGILVAQAALKLAGTFLLLGILHYLGSPRAVGAFITGFYLFYPPQIVYTHSVMAEIPLQFTLLCSLFFLTRYLGSRKLVFLALANLALAVAPLIKPVMVYFWIPNLAFHSWLFWGSRRKTILFLSLFPLLTVSVWCTRNYFVTDYFHFSSLTTSNIMQVHTRMVLHEAEGRQAARDFVKRTEQGARRGEVNGQAERAFLETALKHWDSLAVAYARGALLFFVDPGRFDVTLFCGLWKEKRMRYYLRDGWLALPFRLMEMHKGILVYLVAVGTFNLLILLGFFYFLFKGGVPVQYKVFLILLVVYVTAAVGPIGTSRFRVSVVPLLFLAQASVLTKLCGFGSRKNFDDCPT